MRNYINWLTDNSEKTRVQESNDVMDGNGSEIDFENTKDQFNVFVFDNAYPSLANPNKMKGTLEVFFADHPNGMWRYRTSKLRGRVLLPCVTGNGMSGTRLIKSYPLLQRQTVQPVPRLGNDSVLAKATKITAKKNFASSMHSHKIGSVNSVDDLYRLWGISTKPCRRRSMQTLVAVYQLPFVAFEKSINDEGKAVYTFRGLYTMGPIRETKTPLVMTLISFLV